MELQVITTPSWSITALIATLIIGYLTLVRCLRWKHYNVIHAKYASKIEALTPEEAQEIVNLAFQWDMPSSLGSAGGIALLMTYGIPSISRLLVKTGQLNSPHAISKRLTDTGILTATWRSCPINGIATNGETDPRAMLAVARTKWLHSRYSISNEDFLYTLYAFINSPISFAEKWGWRRFSPLEKQATYVFWAEIGRRMDIQNIPDSLDELTQWAQEYERETMVPAESNRILAQLTMDEIVYHVPEAFGMKQLYRNFTESLLDNHLRRALMLPEQTQYMHVIRDALLFSVAFAQRHLLLPRRKPESFVRLELPDIASGCSVRSHPSRYLVRPWYKPESTGLGYLRDKLAIVFGLYADMPGPHLKSEGYILQSLGPLPFSNVGHESVIQEAERLQGHGIPEAWRQS